MVITDRRAETARTTVHHEPKPARLIRLQLDEMIAAPDCGELQDTGRPPERFKPCVTECRARKIAGHRNSPAPMSALSRYRIAEPRENLASKSRLANRRRFGVKRNCQH